MARTRRSALAPGALGASQRGRGHISSFGDGRVCAGTGCHTVLSRYNDAERCWTHVEELVRAERAGIRASGPRGAAR